MKDDIRALLLHLHESPVAALKLALENHFIWTERARSCEEATASLAGSNPPHLVFTDTDLPDGTWCDVLDLAARASLPVSVIVVSPVADVPLYIDVMERRAFDFITHSFTTAELTHILRCAVENVRTRRQEHMRRPAKGLKKGIRPDKACLKKT